MGNSSIVAEDPSGLFSEGQFISSSHAHNLRLNGGGVLPVVENFLGVHANSGFFKRCWGRGAAFHEVVPSRQCPMALYLMREPGYEMIYWCARVEADGDVDCSGQLRLIVDTSTGMPNSAGFNQSTDNQVDLSALGEPDKNGGWVVYGKVPISIMNTGMMSLSLYGYARGCKVIWSAVTQAAP